MTEGLANSILTEIIKKQTPKVNYQSCYFYGEFRDMNAKVPYCDYYDDNWDYCPCRDGKDCDKYIDRKEVRKMVKEYVDAEG